MAVHNIKWQGGEMPETIAPGDFLVIHDEAQKRIRVNLMISDHPRTFITLKVEGAE